MVGFEITEFFLVYYENYCNLFRLLSYERFSFIEPSIQRFQVNFGRKGLSWFIKEKNVKKVSFLVDFFHNSNDHLHS